MEEQPTAQADCPSQRACSTHRRGSCLDRSPKALRDSSPTASPVRLHGKGLRYDDGVWMMWASTKIRSFAAGAYGYCFCWANGFHHHSHRACRRFLHGGGSAGQDLQTVPGLRIGCYVRRKDTWVDVASEEECAGVDGQGMPMAHEDAWVPEHDVVKLSMEEAQFHAIEVPGEQPEAR
ncbi:hypothetical protein PpBr36_01254 [Pyricularia pennisetigena]|uniref:hypothetical protein n=1 Tax=Pyricularia pennisetigena TaxID=1578925 RepID=UPI00114F3CDA|nr:hypothetical protein PpBr36_01254 [Pyricularia pennisetigena]TLS28615.1 hypothetical protein PpBr36_01254 [Pyricularia pennisetigena]